VPYFYGFGCIVTQHPTTLESSIKLNPFSVKMLTMHRWFDISAAEQDLKYKPIIGFKEG